MSEEYFKDEKIPEQRTINIDFSGCALESENFHFNAEVIKRLI
jgi:hypothetical protein